MKQHVVREMQIATARPERFDEVARRALARRSFLKGSLAVPALLAAPIVPRACEPGGCTTALSFQPVSPSTADQVEVPAGYVAEVLLDWGDALFPGLSAFDIASQTAVEQAKRFGYNCDFVYFFPLPRFSAQAAKRGVLEVNHEYTNPELMFPGYVQGAPTPEQVNVELAAHGATFVEIERRKDGGYDVDVWSRFNRRITAETTILLTGPAAGDPNLVTGADPSGRKVKGMLNNCGGGVTPWGTLLTCEENFNQYFANNAVIHDAGDPRGTIHARYGLPPGASERRWETVHDRFDLSKEPNEPFRFGYVVEIDPYDPKSIPKKRTALGRFKHEAATCVPARDGRVVVYSGDDERFQFMYKFVSKRAISKSREKNDGLLDEGTLYVAKFDVDMEGNGVGTWIPLIAGEGPLADWTPAQVAYDTRGASALSGATAMDRPEDIETNPVTGKLYVTLTNNTARTAADPANPRVNNRHGHILEVSEDGDDATATSFRWDVFILCGDPANAADGTFFAGFDPSRVSPISSPDNITFDSRGNLWIATDGQINTFRKNDGIYAVPTQGSDRGFLRQFLSGVPGGEVASLAFAPGDETLFASIQHPGEGSTLVAPASHFPEGGEAAPRPAVVAVRKLDRDCPVIGSDEAGESGA